MKIFITGATGFIGQALTRKLVGQGHIIHALVRNPSRCTSLIHPNIVLFTGDVHNGVSITNAIKGCRQVYHVTGDTRLWAKDPKEIFETNVIGTINVFNASLKEGVERVVFTSSCGVLGPGLSKPMTEEDPRLIGFDVAYELSKKIAEDYAQQYAGKGLNVVIVRPSKVYGPGKTKSKLSLMSLISGFLKNKFIMIPAPGTYLTNFSFVEDVAEGHVLAMKYGRKAEKYILGGVNISHEDFFSKINGLLHTRYRIIKTPKAVVTLWAYSQILFYWLFGKKPLFPPKSVKRAFSNNIYSSEKAIRELHYHITPLEDALSQTINYLKTKNHEKYEIYPDYRCQRGTRENLVH